MSTPHVLIVGAGLAGSLLASFLAKRGFRVDVCERRPDPRAKGFVGGRSINLALSARGIDALERIGLAERVLADVIPMRARLMHDTEGRLSRQPYSADPNDAINSVSRGGLNLALLDAADEHDNVTLHFNRRCDDIDLDRPAATFTDETTNETVEITPDLIIGADGAFSAVRRALQDTAYFSYSQSFLDHRYKELTIPPNDRGEFALEPEVLHIWPRGGSMMIALPNPDRSFTCTLFWPKEQFEALDTDDKVRDFFDRVYPDAVPLMPTLVEDYRENPVGPLVTVRCDPWRHEDKVVILGDAAHAIVPFFGQGMNAAFEDCVAFDRCIERHGSDWGAVLEAFSAERIPNADAIADMALTNFIEMRDKTASKVFLLQKKGEKILHRIAPWWYTPLYNLVSFSTVPYAAALARSKRQRRILRRIGIGLVAVVTLVIVAIGARALG